MAAAETALDTQPLIAAIRKMLEKENAFEGYVKWLYEKLEVYRPDSEHGRFSRWPNNSGALGKDLKRFAPQLRKLGIDVQKLDRTGEGVPYRITFTPQNST